MCQREKRADKLYLHRVKREIESQLEREREIVGTPFLQRVKTKIEWQKVVFSNN